MAHHQVLQARIKGFQRNHSKKLNALLYLFIIGHLLSLSFTRSELNGLTKGPYGLARLDSLL